MIKPFHAVKMIKIRGNKGKVTREFSQQNISWGVLLQARDSSSTNCLAKGGMQPANEADLSNKRLRNEGDRLQRTNREMPPVLLHSHQQSLKLCVHALRLRNQRITKVG